VNMAEDLIQRAREEALETASIGKDQSPDTADAPKVIHWEGDMVILASHVLMTVINKQSLLHDLAEGGVNLRGGEKFDKGHPG